jgi:hypothetical protein
MEEEMTKDKKIIMYDSPEAAEIKTVTGWVSANGHYWGDNEHMARYDGSTHKKCECGEVIEKNFYCQKCFNKKVIEEFYKMDRKAWDGETPLYSRALQGFIWSVDDLDYLKEENDMTDADLKLVICEPRYAKPVNVFDHFEDDLPEEADDVPAELQEAFDELNRRIKEYTTPLAWFPSKYAVEISGNEIVMEDINPR